MDGPRPARAIVAPLWSLFTTGLLLLATACSSGSAPKETTVRFTVCENSETWTRPSEEEQAKEVWARPRYGGADFDKLRAQLYEDFFLWHGGNSELFDSWPLHGLWAASDGESSEECRHIFAESNDVALGKVVWLYLLSYEAKQIELVGNSYQVTVKETPTGYQAIAFDNVLLPESPDYYVVIVDGSGTELARLTGTALLK